ncbi:ADIPOR-like receptor [Vanrija pseudolonga]|uniref:ADIPOR-like receptor n=1 Tax=Vanrija pseudolonga TaxID=143232 RepID=A0AAF1BQ63_9TREE|nr:ADIPOR-like receptor [Vanrija pseudolonga]
MSRRSLSPTSPTTSSHSRSSQSHTITTITARAVARLSHDDSDTDSEDDIVVTVTSSKASPATSSLTSRSSSTAWASSTSTASSPSPAMPDGENTPLVPKHDRTPAHALNHPWHKKPKLLTYAESLRLVPWQTDNEWITRGYRPQLRSIRSCLWSAIGYVHNETVNIHTHSIGAAFFAFLLPYHLLSTHFPSLGGFFPTVAGGAPVATVADKLGIACYCVCAVTCLGLSSWFHTVQCCNREVCALAHSGDYIGIVVLIVGSILPGMYYGFHGSLGLQVFYMAAILGAGITSGYIVLSPHHKGHRWHRTLTFIALGLSAVFPVAHVMIAKGLDFARDKMGVSYIVAGGASYIFGALLYAGRIPERLAPGKFDYIGSSHQIFHCFVLLGAWFQFSALRWMSVGRAVGGW